MNPENFSTSALPKKKRINVFHEKSGFGSDRRGRMELHEETQLNLIVTPTATPMRLVEICKECLAIGF